MSQELINGSWNQTISYQLEQLYVLIDNGVITVEQLQAAIASLTGETVVTVINTTFAPQQTVYIRQTTPLPQPVRVEHQQQVIPTEPKTVVLQDQQIITQVCGCYTNNDFFPICANKVREYINFLETTNTPRPGQFNMVNTGVKALHIQYQIEKQQRTNPNYQPLNTTDFSYQGSARIAITARGRQILAAEHAARRGK